MATQDTSAFLPPNRRASLHVFALRRPTTSCGVDRVTDLSFRANLEPDDVSTTVMFHPATNRPVQHGGGSSLPGRRIVTYSQEHPIDTRLEDQSQVRRSASKSLSSFRSGAHEITSLVRKMSLSFRPKNSRLKQDLSNASNAGLMSNEVYIVPESAALRSKGSMWFRTQKPNRRPSLPLLNQTLHAPYPPPSFMIPVPGTGPVPPIVPQSLHNGAAARAAAAAQNEALLESAKVPQPPKTERQLSHRLSEMRLTRDSESGIGIDLKDQTESMEDADKFIRRDPSQVLPTEIMEQILSYLDPISLMNAQLVCSPWNSHARSRHIWRRTFHREYDRHNLIGSNLNHVRLPAAGLGKGYHDQDWKKMYKVRRALDQRWQDGQAAAIYLNGHKDSVYCVQFDEQKIITGSRDQTIRIWDARTFQCIKIIGVPVPHGQHPMPQTWAPPLSPTGLVPLCSINTSSRDPIARKNTPSLAECHKASILCLQFDDEIMVTGSSDSTCIIWSIADNYTPVRRLRGHSAGVLDVCFDHRYIITCSKDTTICVWERSSGELIKRLSGHRGPVNAVQLKGELVVSASGDGIAKLWNLASGHCIKEFPSRDRGLACVEFSDDGKTILAGGNDQVIYQFDANTAELVRELKGHKNLVRSLHLDTINNRIVSGSYDMSIKVWDAEKGCDIHDGGLKLDFEGWTTSWMLAAKSDYRRVVATSQDGRAVILDFGYALEGVELLEA